MKSCLSAIRRLPALAGFVSVLLPLRAAAPQYFLTTVAGYITPVSEPIALNQPDVAHTVAYDSKGNLYYGNGASIWRLNASGSDTLIAGSLSSSATYREGEPAVDAPLNYYNFAFDSLGNLYIGSSVQSGSEAFYIYKVTADGTIHTFAGNGSNPGVALPATGPNVPATSVPVNPVVLTTDRNNNVYVESEALGTSCAATLSFPEDGTSSMVVSPGPTGNCFGPTSMAVSESELFLVGDVTGVAGDNFNYYVTLPGGPATPAIPVPQSLFLIGVAVGPNGWFYGFDAASSSLPGSLVEVNPQALLQVEPVPDSASIPLIANLAVNPITGDVATANGGLWTAKTGKYSQFCCAAPVFSGDGGPAVLAVMDPGPLVADAAGDLYLADVSNNRIRKITPNGIINTIAGTGTAGDTGDHQPALQAEISLQIHGELALDGAGNLYFINPIAGGAATIRKVDSNGIITTVAGGGSGKLQNGVSGTSVSISPTQIACDSAGNVFFDGNIAPYGGTGTLPGGQIFELNTSGTISLIAGTGYLAAINPGTTALAAGLSPITGLAVDRSGVVYIGDEHQVIWKIDPQGNLDLVAGVQSPKNIQGNTPISAGPAASTVIYDPENILFDAQGNIYFSDSSYGPTQILMVDTSGNLTPIGGGGTRSGSSADGGNATLANLIPIHGLAIDGSGNLYISYDNQQIRKMSPYNPANPPPYVSQGGVIGAGGSVPPVQAVSPGGEVSIFGANFVAAANAATVGNGNLVNGKVPTTLAGVCVNFGSTPAAMLGVYPNQLNVQVGALTPDSPVTVQVTANCGTPQAVTSNFAGVIVQTASPEFYSFKPDPIGGHNPIAAVNAVTGAYIGPPGLLAGVTFVPAKPGDIVQAYATGFGATTPSYGLGVLPGAAGTLNSPYSLTLGGVAIPPSSILYAGISPCCAGFYQVDFTVPQGTASGALPLVITIAGVESPPEAYIQVQ